MELVFAWMPLALAGAAAVMLAIRFMVKRRRRRSDGDVVPGAHSSRLFGLPEYRRAYSRARLRFLAVLVLAGVSLGALTLVAARPVTAEVVDNDLVNRDIVLCLDVSGSMLGADAEVLETFSQLAERFQGERVSLVIWNSSAIDLFPLTDDYPFVEDQLKQAAEAAGVSIDDFYTDDQTYDLWSGTLLGDGSSLIGDGLASCILRFDHLDTERSRTVILATDNQLAGTPLVSLDEASAFAVERGVRVYGISPAPLLGMASPELDELQSALRTTDGDLYTLGDLSGTSRIVDDVLADQATHLDGVPELVVTDHPGVPFVIGMLALWIVVFLGWRLRT